MNKEQIVFDLICNKLGIQLFENQSKVTLSNLSINKFNEYKIFKEEVRIIYKQLTKNLIYIKKHNKIHDQLSHTIHNKFLKISFVTDFDEYRNVVEYNTYNICNFKIYENQLKQQVRIFHVLYSALNGHKIKDVDKNFIYTKSTDKNNSFYLLNYLIRFVMEYFENYDFISLYFNLEDKIK